MSASLNDILRGVHAPQTDITVDPLANLRPRCNLTPEQSLELLKYTDVDSYDSWVQAGMALHHEYGDGGLELWCEWSRDSDKYPGDDEAAAKFASFGRNAGSPVTMRAVINAAKRAGAPRELWGAKPVAANFSAVVPEGHETTSEPRYGIVYGGEYVKRRPPGWIVQDVVPDADLGLVYAESGAGKTFWVADLALHIAAGLEYRGRKVKQRRVLYVCAEGAAGFAVRLRVMAKHLGLDWDDGSVQFDVLPGVPNFLDPKQVAAVIAAAKERGHYDVVIVDTLAQVTSGGDENSAEDMGKAITHCRQVRDAVGAMVILVHHAGKDASKGARGWSGLRAAVDFEVAIVRDDTVRKAKLSKQKDGNDGDELYFTLMPEPAGVFDADGVEASSCWVRHDEPPPERVQAAVRDEPRGERKKLVLRVARELCGVTGHAAESDVVEASVDALPKGDSTRAQLRHHVRNKLVELANEGRLELHNGVVRVSAMSVMSARTVRGHCPQLVSAALSLESADITDTDRGGLAEESAP